MSPPRSAAQRLNQAESEYRAAQRGTNTARYLAAIQKRQRAALAAIQEAYQLGNRNLSRTLGRKHVALFPTYARANKASSTPLSQRRLRRSPGGAYQLSRPANNLTQPYAYLRVGVTRRGGNTKK